LVFTAREVVCCLLDTGDALIEACIATEHRAKNAVLEPGWVLEVNVQLTVKTVVGDRDSWANRRYVRIKDQSEAIFYHVRMCLDLRLGVTYVDLSAEMKDPTVP